MCPPKVEMDARYEAASGTSPNASPQAGGQEAVSLLKRVKEEVFDAVAEQKILPDIFDLWIATCAPRILTLAYDPLAPAGLFQPNNCWTHSKKAIFVLALLQQKLS